MSGGLRQLLSEVCFLFLVHPWYHHHPLQATRCHKKALAFVLLLGYYVLTYFPFSRGQRCHCSQSVVFPFLFGFHDCHNSGLSFFGSRAGCFWFRFGRLPFKASSSLLVLQPGCLLFRRLGTLHRTILEVNLRLSRSPFLLDVSSFIVGSDSRRPEPSPSRSCRSEFPS